jgi:two-component system, cell cycle sensor histidine kinase and response regulator CckA
MKRKTKGIIKNETKPGHNGDAWFRTTLYSIGDAVITIDTAGTVLQMNHIAEQLTGWKETEAAGKQIGKIFRILNEETREPVESPVDRVMRDGAIVGLSNHTLLLSRDNREIPITDSGAPIRDADGTILGVVLVFRDQTVERESERRILESERRLATLMANLPGMSYRCQNDRQWTMEFVSDGCKQLTGYTADDIVNNKVISYNAIIHPDDREYVWKTWQQVLRPNRTFKGEYRIVTKSGKVKWVWEQGQGVFSNSGELVALEGFITDVTEKKKTEQALHESQQMLGSILNTIPVRVFWKNNAGRYLGCNLPFAKDAGFSSSEEIIGKDDYQLGWTDQADRYREDDRTVRESGIPKIGYEEPQTRPDGTTIWLRTSKIPLRNTNGDIIGVLGTYEDITDRKDAEELQRRSESLFRTVWEESLDGMRLTDENGIVVRVNNAFCRMVDLTREELEGKPLSVIYTRERSDHIQERHRQRFIAQTIEPHLETELTLHNGRKVWFEITNAYFEHNEHKPLLLAVFRDITARMKVEKALRESEEKYRSLFEDSQDAIHISRPDGTFIDINPAGVTMFGYDLKSELLSLERPQDLYENEREYGDYLRTLQQDGYVKDYKKTLKRKDGNRITVLETAKVVRDGKKQPDTVRGIIRDITRQLMLEDQLRYAQKMESIGTLAGGIAHDFNNILGIIVGHASLMKLNDSPVKLSHNIEAILKATQRGASLVQQLLTFARKTEVEYEPVRINDVIIEVVQLLNETLPKMIELRIDLHKNVPPIIADVTQIHQILLNLSLNARDAMPKGGTLTIASALVPGDTLKSNMLKTTARNYILIQVSDTGIGMNEETKQRIFDPFFTTKGPGKGTGLGLSLVYSIVESYNGIVDVESEPGRGSSFRIYLPVQESDADLLTTPTLSTDADLNGTERILIIEDEEMLLESLQSILTKRGYTVLTARDGEEGIRLYALHARDLFGNGIDLIISDLGLPKIEGQDVYRQLKKIDPAARIILASGFIEPGLRSKLKKMGAQYFIQKPYMPEKVLRTIRTVLNSPHH